MRNLILFRRNYWKVSAQKFSTVVKASEEPKTKRCHNRMSGWQIHSYSDSVSDLQCSQNLKKPHIRKPSELLVKVVASSVNPIDVSMMSKSSSFFG